MHGYFRFDRFTQEGWDYEKVPKAYGEWCRETAQSNKYKKTKPNGQDSHYVPIDILIEFCEKQIRSRNGGELNAK